MKANQHSRTAEATAAVRAWHRRYHEPLILDDPYALLFTSRLWQVICASRFLSWLAFEVALKQLKPIAAEIICRQRYAEDKLSLAAERGVSQYVVLGAGFDTYAMRQTGTHPDRRVFELDHPASQEAKKARILKHQEGLPQALEFVPIDFERQTLAEALDGSSYDKDQPAFFSWLGVVQYLPPDAVENTLEALGTYTAPGSELVFDYLLPSAELAEQDRSILEALQRFTRRRGEPLASYFMPDELAAMAERCGFEVVEHFSPQDQAEAYCRSGRHGLRPFTGYPLIHLRRV